MTSQVKNWTAAVALLLACGCRSPHAERVNVHTEHAVMNNTRCLLDVYEDGKLVRKNLEPGQQCAIWPSFFCSKAVVVVTAHTLEEVYLGAASYTFLWNIQEVWLVNGVDHFR